MAPWDRESTAGCFQQRAAYSVLRPMDSIWWNTGWCHLIANSEYSTCLSVFWRNKRDGGNSCEGRERGGSQDITQGFCLSSRLTVHTFIKANMSTCKYAHEQIFIHTHTCKGTHTHKQYCFNRQMISTTVCLTVQQGRLNVQLLVTYSEFLSLPFKRRLRHERKNAFSQDIVMDNGVSDAQIPTRSLCLSSVLVVFLQPGCQTVDPKEENKETLGITGFGCEGGVKINQKWRNTV